MDLLLFLFMGYIITTLLRSNDLPVTWKYSALWMLVLLTYLFVQAIKPTFQKKIHITVACSGFIQSILGWIQYFEWTPSNHILFDVTGNFLNPGPLGGYVGLALLILVIFIRESVLQRKHTRSLCLLFPALSVMGIFVLSFSRAAWLSALIAFSWQMLYTLRIRKKTIALVVMLFSLCLLGLYQLKPGSADGRLFIWKVSAPMLLENPLTGSGAGSFSAKYMYAQAGYFENNPESKYIMKSSDNDFAFNEYIRIGYEYGLVGLLLFAVVLIYNWRGGDRTLNSLLRQSILLYIAVFSFFSYTVEIIPIVVLAITCLALKHEHPTGTIRTIFIPRPFSLVFSILFGITLCGLAFFSLYVHKRSEEVQSLIHEYAHTQSPETATALYELYDCNKSNPDYLLGFSRQLYKNREFEKAYELLKQASILTPSSQILCDLGNCCFYLRRYDESETYLRKACSMTPSHILPFYDLFRFYAGRNKTTEAEKIGRYILSRNFKREGSVALQAKSIVRDYLLKKESFPAISYQYK